MADIRSVDKRREHSSVKLAQDGATVRCRVLVSLSSLARVNLPLLLSVVSVICFGHPSSVVAEIKPALPTLTTVGAVHRLSSAEAARAYPVHLNGVITYYDPYLNYPPRPFTMVTDATATIFARIEGDRTSLPLKAGLMVELTGQSNPGDFGPIIVHASLRILGPASLPQHAPRETMAHLLTGSQDAQWVEVEGVVKSVERTGGDVTLKLALADGEMAATTVTEEGAAYESLIDSRVIIQGIVRTLFNKRSQIFGTQLLFPSLATLHVEDPAPTRPFDLPLSPIGGLMQYSPNTVFLHRVHVRGTVTLFWPGRLLCIQDVSASLCAEISQISPITPGDVVDVLGFPQIGAVTPTLADASYRIGTGFNSVYITPVDAKQAIGGLFNAQIVQMEALLIAHDKASDDPTLVVVSGGRTFRVVLPKSADAKRLLSLEPGSRLRITGVCSVQANSRVFTRHDGYPVAEYFQLLLGSGSDVIVIEQPSWWTAEHTLRLLAFVLALTLCMLCWSLFLRVRLRQQSDQLRYQATHDGLTGIWNRKAVLDLLNREFEMAARGGQRVGVMMLDADHFKKVNDTYGHLAGDAVLRELAKRIQDSVRSYDLTGRYGGEEFLIVLPGCSGEELESCAERVRAAVAAAPIAAEGTDLAVTVSVGTAVLDPLLRTQREALEAADSALYQAKHSGRNRVVSGDLQPQPPLVAAS